MDFKKFLQETAAAGSVGAGSIASNPSADSRTQGKKKADENSWKSDSTKAKEEEAKYSHMRAQIAKAKKLKSEKAKKGGFKSFLFRRNVNEDFDMSDIVSRLKNVDIESSASDEGVVSYGIEDDKGNVMRVTVRADQAQEFEETIAKQLADAKDNKKNGIMLKGNSLAEILFNLRDKFEIVTVDFPIIPKDVVYNAAQASKTPNDTLSQPDSSEDFANSMDQDPMGDDGMDPMSDPNADPMGDPTMNDGSNPDGDPEGTDPSLDGDAAANANPDDTQGVEGQANDLNPDMEEGDNVEDFGDEQPSGETDEGSLLTQIIGMLKAQANAEEAKAEASAEESRAKQAEYSAMAADKEITRQEDLARVQAQIDAEKKKEKDAKKYAQIARYNVNQASGRSFGESARPSFLKDALLLTEDQFDNPQQLQKEKMELLVKYKILPTDSQETKNYKQMALKLENAELDARIKKAQLDAQYQNDQAKTPQTTQTPNQQPNQNQPQQPTNTTPQQPGSTTPQQPNQQQNSGLS